jgi:hypothetical protein
MRSTYPDNLLLLYLIIVIITISNITNYQPPYYANFFSLLFIATYIFIWKVLLYGRNMSINTAKKKFVSATNAKAAKTHEKCIWKIRVVRLGFTFLFLLVLWCGGFLFSWAQSVSRIRARNLKRHFPSTRYECPVKRVKFFSYGKISRKYSEREEIRKEVGDPSKNFILRVS